MKRFLPLFAAIMFSSAFVLAADLTPEQALTRFQTSEPRRAASMRNQSATADAKSFKYETTVGELYVFKSDRGFIVLPANDAAPALLAYSDSDSFDIEGNPGLKYWIEFYNNELAYLDSIGAKPMSQEANTRISRPEIKPLITTEWNQEAPYNEMCPKVDGRETVTGCVATAMAQILKYHNYPAHGKGSHSYFWRPGEEELSFDYENTPFQWQLMTDRYDSKSTAEERHAVAELMLACGVSVDMHYEPGGSGAATTLMGESLIDIFGYSPSLWMPNRAFYGYDEWEEMIYADLAQGLPVLYSGAGTAGGHQFICDGYGSDGFFHFNWGWGGLSNGYFLLTALNPDDLGVGGGAGGFNSSQIVTLGVRRPQADDKPVYLMYNTEAFRSEAKSVKAGEDFTSEGLYFNYSLSSMPDGARLGMKFVSDDGDATKYADGPGVGRLSPEYGRRNLQVKFPELADGTYYITPALHVDGEWSDVRMPVGYPSRITAFVKDGVAEIENQSTAKIIVSDVELPAVIYRDRDFPMPFKVNNTSEDEYYGSVTPMLFDADGKLAAKSQFRPVDVIGGESENISDYVGDFTAEKDHEFPAGDYTLIFRDEAGNNVSSPITVKVEILTDETVIKVTEFKLNEKEPVSAPEAVKFTFTVDCESGAYFGSLNLRVFPGDGGWEVYDEASERFYIIGGDTKEVTVTADFSRLDDREYMAAIYKGNEAMSQFIRFRIDRSSTGITEIMTAGAEYEIYDLNGIPRQAPLTPGLYIINGAKVLISE
ncbi:MAG: C10 family peptidase [Muribaculaceae bacterium]|nr:C10 family peptidase [Muribaculaceae bacterium]